MRTFKHCDRPINCRQLIITQHDLDTRPLEVIKMIKLFKDDKAYNSCARAIYVVVEDWGKEND